MRKRVTIVLLQDLPQLGPKGSVHTVSFGYAKNALLPKGMASLANAEALNRAQRDAAAQKRAHDDTLLERSLLKKRVASLAVRIRAKANEKGSLFGGITPAMIGDAVRAQGIQGVDDGMISFPKKIETLGSAEFIVTLGNEKITVPLQVTAAQSA